MDLPGGQDAKPWTLEKFGSLNVRESRAAVKDQDFSWIENFMPVSDRNMRALYDAGGPIYTPPTGLTIIAVFPFNLDDPTTFVTTYYFALFLSDGSAVQFNPSTSTSTTIGSGFWSAGLASLPVCAQYESQYLVIASTITHNAYWVWDGTSLFGAGTLAPEITVTSGGSGYTSAPTVTAFGGSGSGATFSATIENGAVSKVRVTSPGSGYKLNDVVQLAFAGGGSDTQAVASPTVDKTSGGVSGVNVLAGGTNYNGMTVVGFTGGGGTGAEAVVTGATDGVLTAITVTQPGTAYTSTPTVALTAGGGSGAVLVADLRQGQITGITITNGGSGYFGSPQVIISAPDADSSPTVQASAIADIASGAVTSFTITNPGIGYTKATVQLLGGNNAASATATLMPFGMSGDTLETYEDRVWIAKGTTQSQSGAETTSDFSTTTGGGSAQATDSFLRRKIVRLIQANGFLYRFGDSSINVISNVQTSGTPATTSYSNSNVDPQVGTPYRDSVVVFGRAIVFANQIGVYALYGGAAEKVSDEIDLLFQKADFTTAPTAAVITINGKAVYMLLLVTTDPYSNTKRTLLLMWDGKKWWTGSQSRVPTFITTQEIDSVLYAYGSDGSSLFPLFTTPNAGLTKVFQSGLSDQPNLLFSKQINRVYALVQNYGSDTPALNVALDTEVTQGAVKALTVNGGLNLLEYAPQADARSKYGRLLGMTGTTTASDLGIVTFTALTDPTYSGKV